MRWALETRIEAPVSGYVLMHEPWRYARMTEEVTTATAAPAAAVEPSPIATYVDANGHECIAFVVQTHSDGTADLYALDPNGTGLEFYAGIPQEAAGSGIRSSWHV